MGNYDEFKSRVREAARQFENLDKKETIRIVSHLDADGISACSILIKALSKDNRKYSISIVQQIDEGLIDQLLNEDYKTIIFADIGSGQFSLIKEKIRNKKIFILDHHELDSDSEANNIAHVNPHLFRINGSKEISGAGVTFLFAREIDESNADMAHIAIIGAIGDLQEERGFSQLNNEIVELAKKNNKIKVITGLRIFGAQTKPLHKILEYCTEYYIPGVTGSESNSIQFLYQIGIDPKKGEEWKKLVDLTDDELKKLVTGIILKRLDESNPEEIIGPVYILCDEPDESPTRDAKEFATLLNSCGRLNKSSLGIGACLNDPKIKDKAIKNMVNYKKEIVKALSWYGANKESEQIIKGNGFLIIDAKDNILPTMVGTIASILSRSKEIEQGTFIMSLAQVLDGNTKVSLRVSGNNHQFDLVNLMATIADRVDGLAGGHKDAAGAIIQTQKEEEFISYAKEIFRQELEKLKKLSAEN